MNAGNISKIREAYKKALKAALGTAYGKKTNKFDNEIAEAQAKITQLKSQINDDNEYRINKKIKEAEESIATLESLKSTLTPQAEESSAEDLAEVMARFDAFVSAKETADDSASLTLGRVVSDNAETIELIERDALKTVETLIKCQKNITTLWTKIEELDLPKLGILYNNVYGVPLLAIRNASGITFAQGDAKRYNAKICVDRIYSITEIKVSDD
jgi:hypothetical protein